MQKTICFWLSFAFLICSAIGQNSENYPFNDQKVLLEESSCRLTVGDLAHMRFLTEYLIGFPLNEKDKSLLRTRIFDACTDQQQAFQTGLTAAKQVLQKNQAAFNSAQAGLLRSSMLYSRIYESNDPDQVWLAELLQKYNDILVVDSIHKMVLTRADVHSLLNLMSLQKFLLTGENQAVTNEEWDKQMDSLWMGYNMLSFTDKKYTCSAQYIWIQTWYAWQELEVSEKQDFAVKLRQGLIVPLGQNTNSLAINEAISRYLMKSADTEFNKVVSLLHQANNPYLFGWYKATDWEW